MIRLLTTMLLYMTEWLAGHESLIRNLTGHVLQIFTLLSEHSTWRSACRDVITAPGALLVVMSCAILLWITRARFFKS
jgi:hypothetical protein